MSITRGIQPGLDRIKKLLDKTPLPWRAIHVAGTNGKGTVCNYISTMLEIYNQSRYRQAFADSQPPIVHGRFTSPHIRHPYDCITLNQKTVQPGLIEDRVRRYRWLDKNESIDASEFEILTAATFDFFSTQPGSSHTDVVVLEVGMGGRDDATNIVGQGWEGQDHAKARPRPLVTAFTKIGLDHQDFLGPTLSDIAMNKSGIMKPQVPVVMDISNDLEVKHILTQQAGSRLPRWNDETDPWQILREATNGLVTKRRRYADRLSSALTRKPLHLRENGLVAYKAALLALDGLGRFSVDHKAGAPPDIDVHEQLELLAWRMINAPRHVEYPGRLQKLAIEHLTGRKSPILLDGAHNEQSARVLSKTVEHLRKTTISPVTWVLAASIQKDIHSILAELLKPEDKIVAVEFGPVKGMDWVTAMPPKDILKAASRIIKLKPDHAFDLGRDIGSALQKASDLAEERPLVVAGSLYLVGDVLNYLDRQEGGLAPR